MNKTIYILLSFVLIAGISCSKDNGDSPKKGNEVSFSKQLRSFDNSYKNFDTDFETGDEISVFALRNQNGQIYDVNNYADNVRYSYRMGSFVAQNTPIYLPSGNKGLEYYAIFPYSSHAGNNMPFSVLTDQSTSKGYKLSDLRTAYISQTISSTPKLDFYHSLSQVCVKIDSKDVRNKDCVFYLYVKTQVNVDVVSDTYMATGPINKVTMLYDSNTDCHYAIIPPQTISKDDVYIYFDYNGEEFNCEPFTMDDIFSQGSQYYIPIDPPGEEGGSYKRVVFDGQIRPWDNSVPTSF